jgi:hypothetical protein
MPKSKLLILDANVVIFLFEHNLWAQVTARYEIHLSRIVAEQEANHFYDGNGDKQPIDLSTDIAAGTIKIFDVPVAQFKAFKDQFDPVYFGGLDQGEQESLAHLFNTTEQFRISSGDAIVYKVLGLKQRSDQGVSLEELLQECGMGRAVPWAHQKKFREKNTSEGEQDFIRGRGLKKDKKDKKDKK